MTEKQVNSTSMAESRPATASTGWGVVARRVSEWTSKLLATAIVFVGGISLGGQIWSWWQEASLPVVDSTVDDLAQAWQSVKFGSHGGPLRIELVAGDEAAVRQRMRERCLEIELVGNLPPKSSPAERDLLRTLVTATPITERSDLAVYQPPHSQLMLVAVSRSPARIVGWSFAVPRGVGNWSCYTLRLELGNPAANIVTTTRDTP